MTARPLSKAAIADMAPGEFTERRGEIRRWLAAGGVDGEVAPPAARPDGHVFTRQEVAAMSLDYYEVHADRIIAQLRTGGLS